MAKEVIKHGGKRVPFKPEKLKRSIRLACKDAHVPTARVKGIVSKVAGPILRFAKKRKAVRGSVLRTKVLAGLKKAEPKAAVAWMRYEKRRRARKSRRRK